jgi:hypothetical protein
MRVILPSAGLLVLLAACAGPGDDTADGSSRRVIAAIDLSLTLTRVERQGSVDGVHFTISKGTVFTLDRDVK